MPCAPRVPARNDGVSFAIFFSASASSATPAVACSASLENTRCEDAVSSPSRSDMVRSTSTMTGMPRRARLGAEIGAEFRAAVLGQDGVAVLQQRVGVGQVDLPQFRIAEGHDGALAARIDHDVGDRRHQARHVHDVLGVDAFMRELLENVPARCFAGIAHRAADRGAAAEPHDADRGIERVAAADFVEMAGIYLEAALRQFLDAERQIAHRHADAENARRDFRRGSVKVHRLVHHVRPAL